MTNPTQNLEAAIVASGATTAPRVTPADLEANIVSTEIVKHIAPSGQVLRWAVITTRNGFAVAGRPSSAASAENDRQAVGEQIAIDNARGELWALMGYALKEQIHRQQPWVCGSCSTQFGAMPDACPHSATGCDALLAKGK
jgi:hypothetical protein